MLSRLLFSVAAFAAFITVPLRAADEIELKQHWQIGKKYSQTTETTQTSELAIAGQKIEQSVTTTMETSQSVRAHEDGRSKRMTLKYERIAMDMSMAGQKVSFDSSKPGEGNDPLGLSKSMAGIAGKELRLLLNEKDEVTSLENYEEFIKNLGTVGIPGMDMYRIFGKDAVSQMLKGTALQKLPEHSVKAGDSWPFSSDIDLPQLGKVGIKGTYTLKSVGDHGGVECAEIVTDAKISLDFNGNDSDKPANPTIAQLGMKVDGGSLKGTIWFDPKLGVTREAQLSQEMTMTMKNPTDPSATLSIPVKQSISTKLTKIEDIQ